MKIIKLTALIGEGLSTDEKSLVLKKNKGVVKNKKAFDVNSEISILDSKSRKIVDSLKEGICVKKFKENILLGTDSIAYLKEYSRLKIGENVLLQITSKTKDCYSECTLIEKGETCPLIENVKYAKVVNSGKIYLGDEVTILSI